MATEFRCFVHAGRLTAVSLYFDACFFPEVASAAEPLCAKIASFACDVVARVALPSFVLDVVARNDDTPVALLELNPWSTNTGEEVGSGGCVISSLNTA